MTFEKKQTRLIEIQCEDKVKQLQEEIDALNLKLLTHETSAMENLSHLNLKKLSQTEEHIEEKQHQGEHLSKSI